MTTPARVREVRERLAAAGAVVEDADGRSLPLFPVAIGLAEGSALADRVRREHAVATLEIGLGFAMATLAICEALLDNGAHARHVAIDPYQRVGREGDPTRFAGAGLRALEEAGVRDLVEFHEEPSEVVLPRLLADGRRFDLAFVDGSHRFHSVFLDLVFCARLLGPRRVVFVDDAQIPGVRKAIGYCTTNLAWTLEDEGADGPDHVWQILRTGPAGALDRPYTDFVDF